MSLQLAILVELPGRARHLAVLGYMWRTTFPGQPGAGSPWQAHSHRHLEVLLLQWQWASPGAAALTGSIRMAYIVLIFLPRLQKGLSLVFFSPWEEIYEPMHMSCQR